MLRSRLLADLSKVTLVPTAPHLVGEWVHPFPSTPTHIDHEDMRCSQEEHNGLVSRT